MSIYLVFLEKGHLPLIVSRVVIETRRVAKTVLPSLDDR